MNQKKSFSLAVAILLSVNAVGANDFNPETLQNGGQFEDNVIVDALKEAYSLEQAEVMALQVRLAALELLRMDLKGARFVRSGIDENITNDVGRSLVRVGMFAVTISANLATTWKLVIDLASTPAVFRSNWVRAKTIYNDTKMGRVRDRYGNIDVTGEATAAGRASRIPKAIAHSTLSFAMRTFIGCSLYLFMDAGLVIVASQGNLGLWMTQEQYDNYIARTDREINEIKYRILNRTQNLRSSKEIGL